MDNDMVEKIGVIDRVKFGFGGYQDVQIVFEFGINGKSWGCIVTKECGWLDHTLGSSTAYEATVSRSGKELCSVVELMKKAKIDDFKKFVGVPVKVKAESECGRVLDFEILEEAIL